MAVKFHSLHCGPLSWCVSQSTVVLCTPWVTRREKPIQSLLSSAKTESQILHTHKTKKAEIRKKKNQMVGVGERLYGHCYPSICPLMWCLWLLRATARRRHSLVCYQKPFRLLLSPSIILQSSTSLRINASPLNTNRRKKNQWQYNRLVNVRPNKAG